MILNFPPFTGSDNLFTNEIKGEEGEEWEREETDKGDNQAERRWLTGGGGAAARGDGEVKIVESWRFPALNSAHKRHELPIIDQ